MAERRSSRRKEKGTWLPFSLGKKARDETDSGSFKAEVVQGQAKKEGSVTRDPDTGELDLNGLPEDMKKEFLKLLQTHQGQSKFVLKEKVPKGEADPVTPVQTRKPGPNVAKGLKSEEIIEQMQEIVELTDPWEIYTWVRSALSALLCLTVLGVPWCDSLPPVKSTGVIACLL